MPDEPIAVPFVRRPFEDLLSDAVRLAGLSHMTSLPLDLRNAGAKGSILNSVLALEAAANCLVARFQYSSRMKDMVERFQPLEKFEFVAWHISDDRLDRGREVVQSIAELFALRNEYVHPKVRQVTTAFHQATAQIEQASEQWPTLKISRATQDWEYTSAKRCLVVADDFLSHFLIDLCKFTPKMSQEALFPTVTMPDGEKVITVPENRDILQKAKERMGLSFRFLDLDTAIESYVDQKR